MVRRFRVGDVIDVHDRMQQDYAYVLSAPIGKQFDEAFAPALTPPEMLALGVFEGKYLNDCRDEFPAAWFTNARTSDVADSALNRFGVKSRQPLGEWRRKGWIVEPDPRGWFQWYCRYFLGRRLPAVDAVQIKRWRAFTRHAAQVRAHCFPGDLSCRPRQRQALLQWAYDPFV